MVPKYSGRGLPLSASTIATPVFRKEASMASTRIIAILESHGMRSIQKAFRPSIDKLLALYVNNGSKHDLFGYMVSPYTFHLGAGKKTRCLSRHGQAT